MSPSHTRPPTPPPSDCDELQRAYEAIVLAELRKEIDRDERQARLLELQSGPFAAGLSFQERDAIANKGVQCAVDIFEGRTPRAPIPDDVIDLEAVRDRRGEAEIDALEAQRDAFRQQLSEMMATSDIGETGIILETLQALLVALGVNETNLGELKQRIARTLKMIR